jgi:hypothetical protein
MKLMKIATLIIAVFMLASCSTGSNQKTKPAEGISLTETASDDIEKLNQGIRLYEKLDYSKYKIKYHLWEPTASSPGITKWNIDQNEIKEFFLQETIDGNNRVIEIKFMQDRDNIYKDFTFSESPVIRFYYDENTITVVDYDHTYMPAELFEAGLPTQITYTINETFHIEDVCAKVYVSKGLISYFGREIIENGIKEIIAGIHPSLIYPYYFTDSKMNGIIPKTENFDEMSIVKPYDE